MPGASYPKASCLRCRRIVNALQGGNLGGHVCGTSEEVELCERIAGRAQALGIGTSTLHTSRLLLRAHRATPLRLADLLEAQEHNLAHDVGGILANWNKRRGNLGGFLPRFHARRT